MGFSLDPQRHFVRATAETGPNDAIGLLLRAKPETEFDPQLNRHRVDVPLPATQGRASQFADLKSVLERTVRLARDGTMLVPPAPPGDPVPQLGM